MSYDRLGGLTLKGRVDGAIAKARSPAILSCVRSAERRDRVRFKGAYNDPESGVYMGPGAMTLPRPACTEPGEIQGTCSHRSRYRATSRTR